jgi:hypothetical protein
MAAYTCNPCYLEGRGRKITSLRLVQAKVTMRSFIKNQNKDKWADI